MNYSGRKNEDDVYDYQVPHRPLDFIIWNLLLKLEKILQRDQFKGDILENNYHLI